MLMVPAISSGKALNGFFELEAVDICYHVFVVNSFLSLMRNSTICDNLVIQITNCSRKCHRQKSH